MSRELSQMQTDDENLVQNPSRPKINNNIVETKGKPSITRNRSALTDLNNGNSQFRQKNNHSQPTQLQASSSMGMASPFLTNTVTHENNSSIQVNKQIRIKADNQILIEDDDKLINIENTNSDQDLLQSKENEQTNNDNDNDNDNDGEEIYQSVISMNEKTNEQLQDENRRMSLKRQASDASTELLEQSKNQELKKARVDIDYSWDDLDSGDFDDPLMVSEYVNDIFDYLHELELKTLPDPNYLHLQRQLRPKMRSILVDWMVEVHLKFRLLPETLYLSINIMDRFMSKEPVQVDRLQLLATGALFIAAKYEEVYSPSIKNYAYVTDGAFTEEEILGAERFILEILNFNMSYPNPMNFLRRISKADDYDVNTRTIGKYLLEITVIDHKFIGYLPSLCAAAAMYVSRKMVGKFDWNGNLIHYSGGYRETDLKEICEMLIDYLISPIIHEEFFKKYASKKFMKVSILARQWAKKVNREGKNIMDNDL